MEIGILLLAGSIAAAIPSAVDTTLATLPPLQASDIVQLKKRVYKTELENEVTRVLADITAAEIVTGSCDIISSGWGIANGAVEQNKLMGGNKTNALIFMGTKALGLGARFLVRRRQGTAYVACMIQQYEGKDIKCNQLQSMKRTALLATTIHGGLCTNNVIAGSKVKEE